MKLSHKIAIVTGAAQGIGLACAKRLIAEGARVMLVDINPEVESVAASLGPSAFYFQADVSIRIEVEAMIAHTLWLHHRIDILINNAAVTHTANFLDLSEEDFDRVLRINLKSMFLCGQAAAREMVKNKSGSIINMSSANAILAIPTHVPYVVSKGAINQLTKVMALNLAPYNIRVNGIGPGTIMTELAKQAVFTSPEARRQILSRTPLGRCGNPEEVASIAAFLASSDSSYMTGQTMYVDGGRLALNYVVPVDE